MLNYDKKLNLSQTNQKLIYGETRKQAKEQLKRLWPCQNQLFQIRVHIKMLTKEGLR